MSEQRNVYLKTIAAMDMGTKQLVEMVESIFHIEDLFELSKKNSFLAMNFFQLMTNIDYVLFVAMTHNKVQKISPAGGVGVAAEGNFVLTGNGASVFNNDLEGAFLAISHCFKIQSAKMDAMLSADTLGVFMQGTGAAQIAQDAVNSFLGASKDVLNVGTKALAAGAV